MRSICVIAACITVMFAVTGFGESAVANGKASIKFEGTSTLHDFEGTVQAVPFKISVRKDAGKLYATATVRVEIMNMTTDNKQRDKKMYKMFNIKKYTQIIGSMTDAPFPGVGKTAKIPLKLDMHGIKKTVTATVSECKLDDKQASGVLRFTVSLEDFGIKPPSIMGMIRVGNDVEVECDIVGILDSTPVNGIEK